MTSSSPWPVSVVPGLAGEPCGVAQESPSPHCEHDAGPLALSRRWLVMAAGVHRLGCRGWVAQCRGWELAVADAGRHSWSMSQPAPAAGEVPPPSSSSSPHPPQRQPPIAPPCLKAPKSPKFKRAWRRGSFLPAALKLPRAALLAGDARAVPEQRALTHRCRARKLKFCEGCAESQPVPDQQRRQRLWDGGR